MGASQCFEYGVKDAALILIQPSTTRREEEEEEERVFLLAGRAGSLVGGA